MVAIAAGFSVFSTHASSPLDSLDSVARASLARNIVRIGDQDFLTAGAHQFRSLWLRDFCFSSRGLFIIDRADVVRDQLALFLENRRPSDGLIPRVMDSTSPRVRVSLNTLFRLLSFERDLSIRSPLRAEYQDEHGTEAVDSNVLFLLTALDYVKRTGDIAWWEGHREALVQIYHFYDAKLDPADGLVVQSRYADWQDSVARDGKTFYTNLLYFVANERLAERDGSSFGVTSSRLSALRSSIMRRFFDDKAGLFLSLYREGQALPYVSLEGNLLAIDLGFVKATPAQLLYGHLRRSALWGASALDLPGFDTWPDYPDAWKSPAVRFARLAHYHDRIYWSWLMALSAKVAGQMGDRAESGRILETLSRLATRDQAITEVYSPDSAELPLFKSWIYRSETPFSWGSAFVLDALESDQIRS